MIGRKLRTFTLIELLVVIMVIMILATFVSISLLSTKKRSRDEKRINDVNNIAAALDQYALDHVRQFPLPSPLTPGPYTLVTKVDSTSTILDLPNKLRDYLSPFPKDPSSGSSGPDYGYDYVVSRDGLKAAIIVRVSETNSSTTKICNITSPYSPSPSYPETVNYYLGHPAGAIGEPCYYVAK